MSVVGAAGVDESRSGRRRGAGYKPDLDLGAAASGAATGASLGVGGSGACFRIVLARFPVLRFKFCKSMATDVTTGDEGSTGWQGTAEASATLS